MTEIQSINYLLFSFEMKIANIKVLKWQQQYNTLKQFFLCF